MPENMKEKDYKLTSPLGFYFDWENLDPIWSVIKEISFAGSQDYIFKKGYFKIEELAQKRDFIANLLSVYESSFDFKSIKPNSFALYYLKKDPDKVLEMQSVLRYTLYLLYMQLHLNESEKRDDVASSFVLKQKIKRYRDCLALIEEKNTVNYSQINTKDSQIEITKKEISVYESFKAQLLSLWQVRTATLNHILSTMNSARLQLGSQIGLLKAILSLVSDNFFYSTAAKQLLKSVQSVTGPLSWLLLYGRLVINLSLILTHVIKGFWMSEEEAKIPMLERLKGEWSRRKYSLLNDALWGTINLVGFFWLSSTGLADKLLNGSMFLGDIFLCALNWKETNTKQNNFIEALNKRIASLTAEMKADPNSPLYGDKFFEKQTLCKFLKQAQSDKKNENYQSIVRGAQAVSLAVSFGIMCASTLSVLSPATVVVLNILGPIILYSAMALSSVANLAIENIQDKKLIRDLQSSFEFNRTNLAVDYNEFFANVVKLRYLEKKVQYNTVQIFQVMISSVLLPAVAFAALVFLPTGLATGVALAGLLISHLSARLVKYNFEPNFEKINLQVEKEHEPVKKMIASNITLQKYRYFQPVKKPEKVSEHQRLNLSVG